ncbi:MAG: hypothetical protein IPL40_09440 [Proteobacteria bacterium]|nr:hypothetical protein [Pseudomonadota bacterium]
MPALARTLNSIPLTSAVAGALVLALAAPVQARRMLLHLEHGRPVAAEHQRLIERLVDALGPGAVLHGEALSDLVEQRVSRAPGPTTAPSRLGLRLAHGRERFVEGEYSAAAVILSDLRDELLARPALLGELPPLRDALYQTTLLLALARQRAGEGAAAAALWSALARGFPDREPSRAALGPEPVEYFRAALDELRAARRGFLTVTSARDRRCMVVLDERPLGVTPLRAVSLPVGRYRVYAHLDGERGRVVFVELRPGAQRLVVDCARDAALQTGNGAVALRYATEGQLLAQLASDARSIGAAVAADQALLVEVQGAVAQATLTGSVVRVRDGRLLRRASVGIAPTLDATAGINALARFLLRGAPSPLLVAAWASEDAQGRADARTFGPWPWIALAGGLASLGAGIPLLLIDGHGTCSGTPRCPKRYATATPGVILTAAGSVALAGAATLFALRRGPSRARPPSATLLAPSIGPWVGQGIAGLTAAALF